MRRSTGARGSASAAAAALIGAGALGGCVSTATYGTGEAPEMSIVREVTGGLAGGAEPAPIDYQPRAPLVMPPSNQLRPPVQTASAEGNWPREQNQPGAATEGLRDMSPEYAARIRPATGLLRSGGQPQQSWLDERSTTPPTAEARQQFRSAVAEAEGVPQRRRFLTDPPNTYREPAACAPTQFETIDPQPQSRGFFRRLFGG